LLEEYGLPTKFSFEQDFLEKRVREGSVAGLEQDGYFIDIGVPADYERVQQEWNLLC
jgi:D-glycero-alpha-D-manno-heptose 1-phosphate guanylyltransferase